jgi:DNA-binding transcriptional MerR regulator
VLYDLDVRIGELAARAGTTVRTVRYYVAQGLLPGPVGAGPRSTYAYEHLVRLGAIRALKARYLPLAEIRRRLAAMSAADVEALAAAPEHDETGDGIGLPLVGGPASGLVEATGRPVAAHAGPTGFGLPSARPALRRGQASSTPAPHVGSNVWQRVLLAAGVELSYQLSGDAERDAVIAELIEQATRRLAGLGEAPKEAR